MFRRGILQKYSGVSEFLLRLADVAAVAFSAWLAYGIVFARWWGLPSIYVLTMVVSLLVVSLVFPVFRLYETWRGTRVSTEIRVLLFAWLAAMLLMALIGVLTQAAIVISRLWMGTWFLTGALALATSRIVLRHLLRSYRARGGNRRNVVIVGTGEHAQEVANRLLDTPWAGLNLIGFFDDAAERMPLLRGHRPVLGRLDTVPEYLETHNIDEVWLALPWQHQPKLERALEVLRHSTANVRLVPDIFSYSIFNHSVSEVAGLPVLNLSTTPMEGINRLGKALEDRLFALLVLLLTWPLMLAIAAGVKLSSPGPVLFRQRRHGWGGTEVEVWKFRTMAVHEENDGRITQASRGDTRVTPFGAFLRRTSLDELPQFINVLRGEMSVVGPRPHALYHTRFYRDQVQHYMLRHKVKPGITGWAQVNGYRGETDTLDKMQKRIEYDLYYIRNWSLWFDLKIIFLTVFRGFRDPNAY